MAGYREITVASEGRQRRPARAARKPMPSLNQGGWKGVAVALLRHGLAEGKVHCRERPGAVLGAVIALGAAGFICVNALDSQKIRHPAPILPQVPAKVAKAPTPAPVVREAAKEPPSFLIDGLKAELARAPVKFRLLAQLASPEDPTGDATRAWPEDRELVDLGELTLTQPVADNAAAEKELLFLPSNLVDGIEPSDDPLIGLRDEAYAVSFTRRSP